MDEEKEWCVESKKRMEKEGKVNLEMLHDCYKKNLHIEDTKRIDVVLAVALSNKLEGIPIWMILVGPSGDMKSAQLAALKNDNTYILHNLTSKTLVNGYKDKEKFPDLAPELDKKIVIIPDLAQILKLPPVEKAELWGQLRDLYDGNAGKTSGQGGRARYENMKITLLAASTPAIDGQILINQDLGTRELIYRTSGNIEKDRLMDKCFENEEKENEISNNLKEITQTFLRQVKIKRDYIPPKILTEIKRISTYITYMRATGEIDSFSNELRNDVYPEEPTRIAKQLKRLYICLMSLAEDYPEERALEILWHIAKSSAFPIRTHIFELLLNSNEEISTSKIAELLHIGKSTSQREMHILWNMGLAKCRKEPTTYPDRFYDYWSINKENPFISVQ